MDGQCINTIELKWIRVQRSCCGAFDNSPVYPVERVVTRAANAHLHLERILRIKAERRNHATGVTALAIDNIKIAGVVPVDEKRVECAVRKWFRVRAHRVQAKPH